jgi:hypothetical protein
MGGSKSKGSKNNPDLKIKQKQNKIISVVDCEKNCKNKDSCKEYLDYCNKLKLGKILKGLTCKK